MALRIRSNGRILCAKHHNAEEGDIYIDDLIHEWLAGCLNNTALIGNYDIKKHEWFILKEDLNE